MEILEEKQTIEWTGLNYGDIGGEGLDWESDAMVLNTVMFLVAPSSWL